MHIDVCVVLVFSRGLLACSLGYLQATFFSGGGGPSKLDFEILTRSHIFSNMFHSERLRLTRGYRTC